MTPIIALAAVLAGSPPSASPFGSPVSDAELAITTSDLRASPFHDIAAPRYLSANASVAGEQMDNWWAEDGALLIAEAIRPTPEMPSGLNLSALHGELLSLNIQINLTATTAP